MSDSREGNRDLAEAFQTVSRLDANDPELGSADRVVGI
jgi:hypothetical protein